MKASDLEALDFGYSEVKESLTKKDNTKEEMINIKKLIILYDKLFTSLSVDYTNTKKVYRLLAESKYVPSNEVSEEDIKELQVSIDHVKEFIHAKKNSIEENLALKNLLIRFYELFNKLYKEDVLINKIIREMDV